jgi:hypothetical protein
VDLFSSFAIIAGSSARESGIPSVEYFFLPAENSQVKSGREPPLSGYCNGNMV